MCNKKVKERKMYFFSTLPLPPAPPPYFKYRPLSPIQKHNLLTNRVQIQTSPSEYFIIKTYLGYDAEGGDLVSQRLEVVVLQSWLLAQQLNSYQGCKH